MNLTRLKENRIIELKENVRLFIAAHYDWQAVRQIAENKPITDKAKAMRAHALRLCKEKEVAINSASNQLEVLGVQINL